MKYKYMAIPYKVGSVWYRQHFVLDEYGAALVRTDGLLRGFDDDRNAEQFLREACERMNKE